MPSRSSDTVVTVVGSRGIVGFSGIETMGVSGDIPAALVESKLTWGP